MVDLTSQYEQIREEVDTAIRGIMKSGRFINGPDVKKFQEELAGYLKVPHVITCGNGTDALQVALMSLPLEPGDEVITTPFSFIASIEVIKLLKLKPVLADIRPGTFNIDPERVESAITSRTRAIIPVHLFGQCADMQSLLNIAGKHDLWIIEDAAQALGASCRLSTGENKFAGTMGTIGCTSFFPSKNLGCYGDGGAIVTNDPERAARLQSIVNHGMKEKYHYRYVGVNSRLDTLQAAILRVKLKRLSQYNQRRTEAARYYNRALGNIEGLKIPERDENSSHIYHQYTMVLDQHNRDALKEHLSSREIPSMIYYPLPLHLQEAYSDLGYKKGDFPVTEELSSKVLSLPMHTELDEEQLNYIADAVKEFINKNK